MTTWITQYGLPRILQLEQNVVSGSPAFSSPLHTYHTYPYWTNLVRIETVVKRAGGERLLTYAVTLYLHTAAIKEGIEDTSDELIYDYLETIPLYFEARPLLQLAPHDMTALPFIMDSGAAINSGEWVSYGQPATHKGAQFVLRIPIFRRVSEE